MKSGQMPHQAKLVTCTITQQGCLIIPTFQPYGNNPDCNTSFCVKAQKKHRLSSSPPVFFINKENKTAHSSPTPRIFNKTCLQHEVLTKCCHPVDFSGPAKIAIFSNTKIPRTYVLAREWRMCGRDPM